MRATRTFRLLCLAILLASPLSAWAQFATLGNFVWLDSNRNGLQDSGEVGISGVTVELWNGARTQMLQSTTTNANGIYALQAPTGTPLRIRALLPDPELRYSPMDVGSNNTIDSDVYPSGEEAGFTASFTVPSNVISDMNYDVGMMIPAQALLGDRVWEDFNGNGIQDPGEPGLASVTMQLWNAATTQMFSSTTTNANGIYGLTTPEPGTYRVRIVLPPGYTLSPKDQGIDDLKDSDFNTGIPVGFTDIYTVAPNLVSTSTIDAGLRSSRIFRNGFEPLP